MSFWQIAAAGLVLALVAGFYFRVVRPFGQLREVIRRLANRDVRPVFLASSFGMFRETAGQVQKISDLLQQLDQQVADEGFSLRAILSSMVEGVLIADGSQRIRLVNEPLQKLFDMRTSPINRTIMEVFRNHELQLAVGKTLSDGRPRNIEIEQAARTPTRKAAKCFEVYVGSLQSTGDPHGVVVVFHDITEVKNLEAIRREFVANVSHEFRTPLAIINGYIETLLDGALEDRAMAERFLKVMDKNGKRLNLLIEDLMTISRMEARSPHLEIQEANLREVLRKVFERLEPAIAERAPQIEIDWSPDAEIGVVDPRRIEQVFSNLLENAFRYGPPEGLVLQISASREGETIRITFRDNGPGIPYDDQPHIFERFYRVHKDRSRVAGGTGLGLSIVKNIVLAHGGEVGVQSVPGEGAAFIIRLPANHDAPGEPRPLMPHA